MLLYCLKCRKNTEIENPEFVRTKIGRMMLLSNFVVCHSRKSKSIKEEVGCGLLSSLGIKIPLSKTPSLDSLLSWRF